MSWLIVYETLSDFGMLTTQIHVAALLDAAGQFGEAIEPESEVSDPPQTAATERQ